MELELKGKELELEYTPLHIAAHSGHLPFMFSCKLPTYMIGRTLGWLIVITFLILMLNFMLNFK